MVVICTALPLQINVGPGKIATQITPSRLCFTHRGLESTVVMTCPGNAKTPLERSEFISLTRKQWIP